MKIANLTEETWKTMQTNKSASLKCKAALNAWYRDLKAKTQVE